MCFMHLNLSRSYLIEYPMYCAPQFLYLHVIKYTMFLDMQCSVGLLGVGLLEFWLLLLYCSI